MQKVFFVCPDEDKPSGGVKQIYRQVEILNSAGVEAYVLHCEPGFRCSWFKSNVPVAYTNEPISKRIKRKLKQKLLFFRKNSRFVPFPFLYSPKLTFYDSTTPSTYHLQKDDIIVLPEICGKEWLSCPFVCKKVIYNQGVHLSFRQYDLNVKDSDYIYLDSNTLATIVISKHSSEYFKYAFPSKRVFIVRDGVNSQTFHFSNKKKKQIAFMPRRLPQDLIQLFHILNCRGVLNDWKLQPIENMSEEEVASILKESSVFVSTSDQEGLGLPPIEAIACGCVLVGYHGFGGKEYFDENQSFPVPERDIIAFAKTLEDVLVMLSKGQELPFSTRAYSDQILNYYSLENERIDTLLAWSAILNTDLTISNESDPSTLCTQT